LIVVTVWAEAVPTVTDSNGNVYVLITSRVASPQGDYIFYCYAPTVGVGHTVTATSGNGSYPDIQVQAWSGSAPAPLDQFAGNGGNGLTVAAGSVTPTQNNELIVTGIGVTNANPTSIDSGFTLSDSLSAYLVQGTAGTVNPIWTFGVSQAALATTIASFK
jgi:hypothetical protein